MSCPYPLALLEYYPSETNSPNISSKWTEAECETPKTGERSILVEGFKGID